VTRPKRTNIKSILGISQFPTEYEQTTLRNRTGTVLSVENTAVRKKKSLQLWF